MEKTKEKISFDPKNTAVLIMDYQNDILQGVPDPAALVKRAAGVLEKARAAKMLILHIGVVFREGYPEINAHHPTFGPLKKAGGRLVLGTKGAELHEAVAAKPGEPLVIKKRVNAFMGSDLDVLLRGNDIKNLVLMGVSTSGVVLSTLRYAADMDYICTVIEDCCADGDAEVHKVLTTKVFARQAKVMSSADFIQSL